MADREKVLAWLKICGEDFECSQSCPYHHVNESQGSIKCMCNLMCDAKNVIEEQTQYIWNLAIEKKELRDSLKEQPQWINVTDRMPPETHSMFFKLYGTPKWRNNAMWREESDHVLVAISFEDGSQFVTSGYTQDGKWSTGISKILQYTVTHWMPLPEPPEVKQDA